MYTEGYVPYIDSKRSTHKLALASEAMNKTKTTNKIRKNYDHHDETGGT